MSTLILAVGAVVDVATSEPEVGRVVVLTTFDSDTDTLPAIEAGAVSYLLKDAPADELVRACRPSCVCAGHGRDHVVWWA